MLIEKSDIIDKINKSGLSILDLSKKTGVSYNRLYNFMRGRTDANYKDLMVLHDYFANQQTEVQEEAAKFIATDISHKYIASLEEQIQLLKTQITFLSSNIEASLNLLGQGQAVQLAHLKALEWYLTHQAAGKNEKKHQAELEVLGKMLAMFSNLNPEKGNS